MSACRISEKGTSDFPIRGESAYTLIEVIISFFLFIAIVIPLITGFFSNSIAVRSQEMLTAAWLLEQEAVSLRHGAEPQETEKRKINGKEWNFQMEKSGSPLVRYHITALKNGRKMGEVYVDVFKPEK